MAKEFDGAYVKTADICTLKDGRKIELGHYKMQKKDAESKEKLYIVDEKAKFPMKSTNLTLMDLVELQQIDLSGFDLETDPEEMFD